MQTLPLVSLIDPAQQQEAEAIIRSCVHCGFCNATCPTYQLLGDERDGPRGRIYLIKQMLEGTKATVKTQKHLDRCLTCRACETTCPSGVAYGRLLDIGREVLEQQVRRSLLASVKHKTLCFILPYRQRFAVLFRFAQFFKLLMPEYIRRKIAVTSSASRARPYHAFRRQVLILDGCVQPTLAPGINDAAARVLGKLGIGVVSSPAAGCCGALSYHLSATKDGLDFMRHNIDAWLPYLDQGVEAIIMTASGCGLMVKEYGKLLKHDAIYRSNAERIASATKDIAELLAAEDLSSLKPVIAGTVAVQSPCTLQHGQKLTGTVETLLRHLGFDLTAVADSHLCCGSAGAYSLLQPEISSRLLLDKVKALECGHPDMIVTANIGCLTHLQSMTAIPVRHWIEVLDEALPD